MVAAVIYRVGAVYLPGCVHGRQPTMRNVWLGPPGVFRLETKARGGPVIMQPQIVANHAIFID